MEDKYLVEKFDRPNKYAGKCPGCDRWVASGSGKLGRDDDAGKWLAVCTQCATGDPVVEEAVTQTHPLTDEQQAIVDDFTAGKTFAVQAGAGTGKTSTLVAIAKNTNKTGTYMTFTAKSAEDATSKFRGTGVKVSTIHSLGMAQVGRSMNAGVRLKSKRLPSSALAKALGVKAFYWQYGGTKHVLQPGAIAGYVINAVKKFCNSADLVPDASKHLAYIDGIDVTDDDGNRTFTHNDKLQKVLQPAIERAWADLSSVDGQLPWSGSHDYYLKVWELGTPEVPGDFLLVDEAQDLNPVQASIIAKQGKQTVFVGDSQQAIYEWRGAVDALDNFDVSNTLYLTNSFRFGPEVAEVANAILSEIPDAKLRLVGRGAASTVGASTNPDAVLTRTNAGAIGAVLEAQSLGNTAFLVGCDSPNNAIAYFVKSAQALMDGKRTEHPDLACFSSWKEVCEYVEHDPQGAELELWVKLITKHGIDDVRRAVSGEVAERDADIIVSTAHKSKGLEWDTVRIGPDFQSPKEGEKPSKGELRLLYVAVTRARKHLDHESSAVINDILFGG